MGQGMVLDMEWEQPLETANPSLQSDLTGTQLARWEETSQGLVGLQGRLRALRCQGGIREGFPQKQLHIWYRRMPKGAALLGKHKVQSQRGPRLLCALGLKSDEVKRAVTLVPRAEAHTQPPSGLTMSTVTTMNP